MLAGLQRGRRLRMAHLGRRAERNGINIEFGAEQFVKRRKMHDPVDRSVAAGDRRKFDAVGA